MFVKSIMIPRNNCYVVQHDRSLREALQLLETNKIDALPVLKGDQYVGILTRYQLYKSFFESELEKEQFLNEVKSGDIVTHKDEFLSGDEIFERTLIALKDFPLLAVCDEDKRLLGIVTRFDVLEQFQSAFGMKKSGVRIAFTSVETEGQIARLSEIARQFHESIISLVTFDETDKLVRRIVLKIEKKDNIHEFIQQLEQAGFRILDIVED